jgi:exonuclease III
MNYGTWNVQSIREKMEEIALELGKLKMDVIFIWVTETKRKGTGSEILEGYVHLYIGVSKDRRREVLRNENVLYLVALNAVAAFLFISVMFVYLNVVLSFYCSVGKLK